MSQDRKALNPLLRWLWDLLALFSTEEIRISNDYHTQVADIKEVLVSDSTGIVNSILDFAINTASVELTVESEKPEIAELLEEWFDKINYSLLGKIPTGIQALSREYYRERWKNSSFLVLRSIWEDIEIGDSTFNLPTKMWFVDGMNLVVTDDSETRVIGNEKYYIRIDDQKKKPIPASKNELIFVQKPYSSWSSLYPIPFIIQRGLYKNMKFFNLINSKGEKIVAKALEYLFMMKKGSEQLALKGNPEFTYSEEDLKKAKDDLKDMVSRNKNEPGLPVYATNFDTAIEQIIPDYAKAVNKELFIPCERRILAGLGLIEIVEGIASTRREAILNPRPFITEVENGIKDFIVLFSDIMKVVKERNIKDHPKYFSGDIDLHYSPIKEFVSDSVRDHLRSMYDRGVLSKETYSEVVGGVDFDIEIQRRVDETDNDLEVKMYPPVIDNREGMGIDFPQDKPPKLSPLAPVPKTKSTNPLQSQPVPVSVVKKPQNTPTSKQGPEKKNFKGTNEDEGKGE